jgi:hypothetical protein
LKDKPVQSEVIHSKKIATGHNWLPLRNRSAFACK